MNALKTLTIIFNLVIIVGAGHGGGPLGIFELMSLSELLFGDFQSTISGHYEERLMAVGLISLIGQAVLICSYFFEKQMKSALSISGCFMLLTTTCILTKDAWSMSTNIFSLETFSLFFSLPFMLTAVMLLTREIRGLKTVTSDENT